MALGDKRQRNKYLSSQVKEMLEKKRRYSSSSVDEDKITHHKKTKKDLKTIKQERGERKNILLNITNKMDLPSISSLSKKQKGEIDGPSTSKSCKKDQPIESSSKSSLSQKQINKDEESASLYQKQPCVYKVSSSSDDDMEDEDVDFLSQNEMANEQLFGQTYELNMVHIGKGVYCRYNNMQYAMSSSGRATSIARKLMEGVYKKEALLNSTFTGLPARAQGRDRQNIKVMALNYKAKMAIIAFAIKIASKTNMVVDSVDAICRSMSQHIGEIKREENRKKLSVLNE